LIDEVKDNVHMAEV